LPGTLDLPLFALRYIGPDGLRSALHGFGRHFEAGQQLDLPASMVEWRFGPDQRKHAAHAGRQSQILNVQSHIGRALSVMTVRTQIPRAQQLDIAHGSQHAPRTHLAVTGFLAASARYLVLVWAGRIAP
jgi:hypothetical protein